MKGDRLRTHLHESRLDVAREAFHKSFIKVAKARHTKHGLKQYLEGDNLNLFDFMSDAQGEIQHEFKKLYPKEMTHHSEKYGDDLNPNDSFRMVYNGVTRLEHDHPIIQSLVRDLESVAKGVFAIPTEGMIGRRHDVAVDSYEASIRDVAKKHPREMRQHNNVFDFIVKYEDELLDIFRGRYQVDLSAKRMKHDESPNEAFHKVHNHLYQLEHGHSAIKHLEDAIRHPGK